MAYVGFCSRNVVQASGASPEEVDQGTMANRGTQPSAKPSKNSSPPPDWGKEILVQRYPIGIIGFDWTTFVRELPEIPSLTAFPTPDARDF